MNIISGTKQRHPKVHCDNCGKGFRSEPRTEIRGNAERAYIKCPKCKKEYTAYHTDKSVREKQALMRALSSDFQRARGKDPPRAEELFAAMRRLKQEIGRDMERLKTEYEAQGN